MIKKFLDKILGKANKPAPNPLGQRVELTEGEGAFMVGGIIAAMQYLERLRGWLSEVAHVPWFHALRTLRERFREDRLGLTASSLTFTTIMALVPLVTVALAVFTAFPMFAKLQGGLQQWLVASLIPDNIARQVLGYLTQFAGKASRLGVVGLALLLELLVISAYRLNSFSRRSVSFLKRRPM